MKLPDQASLLSQVSGRERPVDASAGDTAAEDPKPTFEQAMQELEDLVAGMESGELSLEQSLAAYQRGAQLLQICQSALQHAQQQVKILEDGLLQDFSVGPPEQD